MYNMSPTKLLVLLSSDLFLRVGEFFDVIYSCA